MPSLVLRGIWWLSLILVWMFTMAVGLFGRFILLTSLLAFIDPAWIQAANDPDPFGPPASRLSLVIPIFLSLGLVIAAILSPIGFFHFFPEASRANRPGPIEPSIASNLLP